MTDKKKVFLIDDDHIVLKVVSKLFREYDVEVFTFTDPTVALEEMKSLKPELVFLDYNMPLMDGMEVIIKVSEIKLFSHSSLYLLSSSQFSDFDQMKLKTLGFYGILSKPLKVNDIESIFLEHFGSVPRQAA